MNERRCSIIIPYGGRHRLPLIDATLAAFRRCDGVDQIIVSELGPEPNARSVAERWDADYFFTHSDQSFDKPRAINIGSAAATGADLLWCDGDLLVRPDFVERALAEFRGKGCDFFYPFTAIDYLDAEQSKAVQAGTRSTDDCRSMRTLRPHRGGAPGGMGLVRREFIARHGGLIEGFRGWGGEDLAWIHKVEVLGRIGETTLADQRVWHLFHPDSGSYSAEANRRAGRSNPAFAANLAHLRQIETISCPTVFGNTFPPAAVQQPWPADAQVLFVSTDQKTAQASEWARRIGATFGIAPRLVPTTTTSLARALRERSVRVFVAFGQTLSACAAIAALAARERWLLVPDTIDETPVIDATVLARDRLQIADLKEAGWDVWHRPWDNDAERALPIIVQPLSHLLGNARGWWVKIELDRHALSPTALDRPPFWYVGYHDASGAEVLRHDADAAELRALLSQGGDTIIIEREVRAVRPPDRWTVWTVDRQRQWLDNVTGPVDIE